MAGSPFPGGSQSSSPFVGGSPKPTFYNVSPSAAPAASRPSAAPSSAPAASSPSPAPTTISAAGQAALDAANSAGSSGSASSGSSDNPLLFWGQDDTMNGQRASRLAKGQSDKSADRYVTMTDAQQEFYRWSVSDRKAWGQYLLNLGLVTEDESTDYATLQKEWLSAIDEAVNFHAAGKQVNPWQAAALMAGADNPGAAAKSKKAGFTGTKKTRDTRVDLTDPASAKALVNQVLSNQLGRNATDEEIRQFTSVLHNAENANPVVQDTTSTYVNGENTSSSSTSTGGMTEAGRQQVLSDVAMQKPEYGAYQSATVYYNALASAIASPVH